MKRLSITQAFTEADRAHKSLVKLLTADMRRALRAEARQQGAHLLAEEIVTTEWDEVIDKDTGQRLYFIELRADIP